MIFHPIRGWRLRLATYPVVFAPLKPPAIFFNAFGVGKRAGEILLVASSTTEKLSQIPSLIDRVLLSNRW
ncbi:hypothetical protein [Allorhodopirellula solitaria]|uniref:hypothetical protein n=1 Tax=Allorhodopirellula solitaria TaxID=2527987 RepID=UPI0011B7A550|nr:hypothetical protein [Allorhodopirellula solitaria]